RRSGLGKAGDVALKSVLRGSDRVAARVDDDDACQHRRIERRLHVATRGVAGGIGHRGSDGSQCDWNEDRTDDHYVPALIAPKAVEQIQEVIAKHARLPGLAAGLPAFIGDKRSIATGHRILHGKRMANSLRAIELIEAI